MNQTQSCFSAGGQTYAFHDVRAALGAAAYARLPYVARVLAENLLRNLGRAGVSAEILHALADPQVAPDAVALPLYVPRVLVPDSSGIPVLMDLAALRSAVARRIGTSCCRSTSSRDWLVRLWPRWPTTSWPSLG